MPVVGIYTKDFPSLGRDGLGTDLIPVAISGNPITYKTTLSELLATISPALSFGTFGATPNAQGGSYSAGVITLQPASATHPGGVTTGTQNFSGLKTFSNNGIVANFDRSVAGGAVMGLQIAAVDKSFIEWNINDAGTSAGTAMNLRNSQGAIGLYDSTNTGLKISGGNAVVAGTVTATTFNGSGTGLTGVVLTTTNQTVAGNKTFSGNFTLTGATISLNSGGGTADVGGTFNMTGTPTATGELNINRSVLASANQLAFRTGGLLGWRIGSTISGSNSFIIESHQSGSAATAISIDYTTLAVASVGSISSTPQGTLYGTASGSITSAQLATSLTDETGSGSVVFSASPTFTGTVTTAILNVNGATTIDAGNGNQLLLDNAGERFTQITTLHNGSQKASQFWDNTNTYYQISSDVASSTVRVVAQTNGVELANGATSWSAISDFRQKKIIRPIEDALTTMKDFRTVIGRYNTDDKAIERSFLIAQDVQKTYPYAVTVGNDEDKTLRLSYTELIPLLVKAIQELEVKVKILESK